MTQRDQKVLLVIVLSLVGAGIGFLGLYKLFLGPNSDYDRKIADLEDKTLQIKKDIHQVVAGRKMWNDKKNLSLPVNSVKASNVYLGYVDNLLKRSGLKDIDLKPEEVRSAPTQNLPGNAAKKPEHTTLTVSVSAKGPMSAVVEAFDELQRTPLVHRIKSFTLGHQESNNNNKGGAKDTLNLSMTLEAMIVAGTDPKKDVPEWMVNKSGALPPAAHTRSPSYASIAKRNVFFGPGGVVWVPPDDDVPVEPEPEPDPTQLLVKDYVRLVHTDPTNQEAYLRQLLFKEKDTLVKTDPKFGFDTFQILSENRQSMLKAYVLRIDQRDMYIQEKDFVYRVHIGHTVSEGMVHALNNEELKSLDLVKLLKPYDPKKEKAAPAKDAGQKGGGKKGRTPQQ
jgi:hypothetical protein